MIGRSALLAAAAMAAAASPQPRYYVQDGVAAGGRQEVLLLDDDGGFASITSVVKRRRNDALDTEHGYWLYCGRWRAAPGGRIAVHLQLVESFSYYPPPHPGAWQRRELVVGAQGRQVSEGGRRYTRTAVPPLYRGMLPAPSNACEPSRKREPAW